MEDKEFLNKTKETIVNTLIRSQLGRKKIARSMVNPIHEQVESIFRKTTDFKINNNLMNCESTTNSINSNKINVNIENSIYTEIQRLVDLTKIEIKKFEDGYFFSIINTKPISAQVTSDFLNKLRESKIIVISLKAFIKLKKLFDEKSNTSYNDKGLIPKESALPEDKQDTTLFHEQANWHITSTAPDNKIFLLPEKYCKVFVGIELYFCSLKGQLCLDFISKIKITNLDINRCSVFEIC